MVASLKIGDTVTIELSGTCWGGDRPHHASEHGLQGRVEGEDVGSDHAFFVRFLGDHLAGQGLPLGRWFSADELLPEGQQTPGLARGGREGTQRTLQMSETIAYKRLRDRHHLASAVSGRGDDATNVCVSCRCTWPCEVGRALEIIAALLRA